MTHILIVDDVAAMAEQYAYDLRRVAGHEVTVATTGPRALELVDAAAIDCIILDLEMPGMDGFEVLQRLGHRGVEIPVIVYTGTGDFDRCVRAVRLGAAGFIDKAEPMERVAQEVAGAVERHRLRQEVRALQQRLGESTLIGASPAMQTLRETIARLAPIPSTVLILGESGTGKELVARELHHLGDRAAGPFIALNCAALPEHLVESELFGHERGAFTGAVASRKGAFEAADGGTLFLDEIGDLPAPMQAKLLRVLEQRQVMRVGSTRTVEVTARVIAATHHDLDAEVAEGSFREDLLYRLNAHVIRVPPLRDRPEDVAPLAERFLDETCRRFGVLPKRLAGEVRERLTAYHWRRNNVRELRNLVERMVVMADGETIRREHLPAEIAGEAPPSSRGEAGPPATFHELKADAERRIVLAALERHEWHVTRTAESLGLADHASLLKIMRRLGIRRVSAGSRVSRRTRATPTAGVVTDTTSPGSDLGTRRNRLSFNRFRELAEATRAWPLPCPSTASTPPDSTGARHSTQEEAMTRFARSSSRHADINAISIAIPFLLLACSVEKAEPPPVSQQPAPQAAAAVIPAGGLTTRGPVASEPARAVTFEAAEEAFNRRRYDEARSMFESYTATQPGNPWGHYMLGLSAMRSGDPRAAEAAFDEALRLDPGHVKSYLNSARVLMELGRDSEAIERINAALDIDSLSSDGIRLLARVQHRLGQIEAALDTYRHALVTDDRDVWAMNNLGVLYLEEGDPESALPPLARAVELRPNAPVFRNNLGIALERAGFAGAARRAYEAALAADSTYAKARTSLARVTAALGSGADDAAIDLRQFADLFRHYIQMWRDTAARPAQEPVIPTAPPTDTIPPR